jgi:hypothetical protein
MIQDELSQPYEVSTPLRWLIAAESATFLVAAGIHAGLIPIPEPRILPATIVEGAAGLVLGMAAYGAFARRRWARSAAVGATIFAAAGVLLGIAALAAGRGPQSSLNFVYHRVILAVLLGSLVPLLLSGRRGGNDRTHEAGT